jgi:hypothetical protein
MAMVEACLIMIYGCVDVGSMIGWHGISYES